MPSLSNTNGSQPVPTATFPSPPAWLHHFNALLHQEPVASLAYSLYWIVVLTAATPIAIMFLIVQALYSTVLWAAGWTGARKYDPSSKQQTSDPELAVVITGCDSGFGKELALLASHAGFVVFAGCLSKDSFAHFTQTSIRPLVMDVTKDDQVQHAVQAVQEWISQAKAGKPRVLHALCNNAGIITPGFIDWIDLSVAKVQMEVNYFGTVRCCKAFLPLLKRQVKQRAHTGSRILNIASMAGKVPCPGILAAYCASKHAVVAFSHCLRMDLAPFGIQVGTLCPVFHGTPMVKGSQEKFDQLWESLPTEIVEEYGDDYLNYSKKQNDFAQLLSWRIEVVVDQLMKALLTDSVAGEQIVGMDGKFGLTLFQMMPPWVAELGLRYVFPRPIPACLKKKT